MASFEQDWQQVVFRKAAKTVKQMKEDARRRPDAYEMTTVAKGASNKPRAHVGAHVTGEEVQSKPGISRETMLAIQQGRQRCGLSQDQLARAISGKVQGSTASMVQLYENGRHPNPENRVLAAMEAAMPGTVIPRLTKAV